MEVEKINLAFINLGPWEILLILIIILIFGIYQCNFSLKNYIVHPHLTELNFIRKHIEQDVLKIIESGEKPSILIIRNPSIKENNQGNDYDLTINFSHNWLVSATIYALRQYDIWTIITHRVVEWDNSKGIHIVSIWCIIIYITIEKL